MITVKINAEVSSKYKERTDINPNHNNKIHVEKKKKNGDVYKKKRGKNKISLHHVAHNHMTRKEKKETLKNKYTSKQSTLKLEAHNNNEQIRNSIHWIYSIASKQ